MTRRQWISIVFIVCVLFGYTALVSIAGEIRLNRYEDRMHQLECRHVLFEDGSSLHKDAELTQLCIDNR